MKIPANYTALEAFHIRGHNSHHSAVILQPTEANKKPIVLLSSENTQGKSVSNAMEDIAGAVMDKMDWSKDSDVIWLEVSEADPISSNP